MLVENDGRMAAAVPLGAECDTASSPHFVPNGTGYVEIFHTPRRISENHYKRQDTMESNKSSELDQLTEKILKGIQISFEKLVRETAKNDEELIFGENGRIVRIKAKDILNEMTVNNQ
jgi:hypothetical protein